MSRVTIIPFCTATHNFWIGCIKVSAGCKFCYFYRDYENRYKKDPTKIKLPAVNQKTGKSNFDAPVRWKKPEIIFINSWSDFFIKEADAWRNDAWKIIKDTPHFYIIITKRIERAVACLPADWGKGYPNVIIMVSTENQKTFNFRVKKLLEVPGYRGIIAEPLLSPIDMRAALNITLPGGDQVKPIHWVIAGGESGNETGPYGYRDCKREWLHEIVKQCAAEEVPVFIKQLGSMLAKTLGMKGDRHGEDMSDPRFPIFLKKKEYPEFMQPYLPVAPVVPATESENTTKENLSL